MSVRPQVEMFEGPDAVDGTLWPFTSWADTPSTPHSEGAWHLLMSRGGSVVLWPSNERAPEDLHLIGFFKHDDKELLKKFLVEFCSRGWETDDRHIHQDGTVWLFNWQSWTVTQTYVAAQVAEHFVAGRRNEAWDTGRAFEKKIQEAIEAWYEAKNSAYTG